MSNGIGVLHGLIVTLRVSVWLQAGLGIWSTNNMLARNGVFEDPDKRVGKLFSFLDDTVL
jgi:type IV secretory pathway TrbD component